jgi:hypothetical protein
VHINVPKIPQRSYAGLLVNMPVCNKNLVQKDCCRPKDLQLQWGYCTTVCTVTPLHLKLSYIQINCIAVKHTAINGPHTYDTQYKGNQQLSKQTKDLGLIKGTCSCERNFSMLTVLSCLTSSDNMKVPSGSDHLSLTSFLAH